MLRSNAKQVTHCRDDIYEHLSKIRVQREPAA
jgi:hypothetical protein